MKFSKPCNFKCDAVNFLTALLVCGHVHAMTQAGNEAALIEGPEAAQASTQYLYASVVADVDASGNRQPPDSFESVENLDLKYAHRFADDWQAGTTLQLARRRQAGDQSISLSQFNADIAYQYLPAALAFVQLTVPTSRSVYENPGKVYQLNALGRGFWSLAAGTYVQQDRDWWLDLAYIDVHRSLPRSFDNADESGRLVPGWGGYAGAGLGVKSKSWVLTTTIEWEYEDPVEVQTTTNGRPGSAQRYTSTTLTLGYKASDQWEFKVVYLDQTLLGNGASNNLLRGVLFNVQWSVGQPTYQ
jgi:hypothetical protein